ncbi:hypothetical protein [Cupriavidus pauculus]|uniref:hypothetical protein n=1 Tax=Cupriavidus pauculus TaxID=82633 RepID=UPI00385741D6
MSTSDESKRDTPPTLFGPQQGQEGGADVRILAGLEGRVPAAAAVRPGARAARGGRQRTLLTLVAVLMLAGVASAWWAHERDDVVAANPAPAPAPATNAAPPADPSNQTASAASVAGMAQPQTETTVSNATPDGAADATVIDVSSADVAQSAKRDEVALDQLGRTPESATAAAMASLAAVGAAHAATHKRAGDAPKSPPAVAKNTNAKSDGSVSRAEVKSGSANSLAKAGSSDRKKATRKKAPASRAEDDPDADVLAALMAPPPSSTVATKGRTRSTTRTQ